MTKILKITFIYIIIRITHNLWNKKIQSKRDEKIKPNSEVQLFIPEGC